MGRTEPATRPVGRGARATLAVVLGLLGSLLPPVGAAADPGPIACADVPPLGAPPGYFAADDPAAITANLGFYVDVDLGANDGCLNHNAELELRGTPKIVSGAEHLTLESTALDQGVVRVLVEYGFCGVDSFTYQRTGEGWTGNLATVVVTVAPAPGATCDVPHDGLLVQVAGGASYTHGSDLVGLPSRASCLREDGRLRQVVALGWVPGVDGRPAFLGLAVALSDEGYIGFLDIDDPAFGERVRIPFVGKVVTGGDAYHVSATALGRLPDGGTVAVGWVVRNTRADTTEAPGGTGCLAPLP